MSFEDLDLLIGLNDEERSLKEIQEQINKARAKYFDVSEIQLHLDRRQAALDERMKRVMNAKGFVISPN
jgi:hypothetical protein